MERIEKLTLSEMNCILDTNILDVIIPLVAKKECDIPISKKTKERIHQVIHNSTSYEMNIIRKMVL